jgi:hypothetical protein
MWRAQMPTNCSVEATMYLGGANALAQFGYLGWTRGGVYARVTGGSLLGDATVDVRISAPTCYYFECYLSGANLVFEVGAITGGTRTAYQSVSAPGLSIDVTRPIGLRLDVWNFSGVPILWCWISNIRYNGVDVTNFLLFAPFITDLTGTAVTGQGRAGFSVPQDLSSLGFSLRGKIVSFQVREITGISGSNLPIYADPTLRDEFLRQQGGQGFLVTSDFGIPSPSVQSFFTGDQHTLGGAELLVYPTTTLSELPHATGTSTTATTLQVFHSLRPPDDSRSQTPEVQFNLIVSGSSGTSAETGAGVIAHASGGSGIGPTLFGYMALAVRIQTGIQTWRVDLYRVRFGALELLATGPGTISAGSASADILIALEISPAPGTPSLDGPVRMRVLAGTPGSNAQTLTVQSVPGVAADGAYIIDSSADRITSGGEGMVFYAQNSTHQIRFEQWNQGTLIDPPDTQNDLPSVVLDAEPEATEELTDYCDVVLPITAKFEWQNQAVRCESGHVWTLAHEKEPRRVWQGVETRPMTKTKRDAFLAFWREHRQAFLFTDAIKGATYSVRGIEATLDEQRLFKNTHVFRFDMEELRS